MNTTKLDLVWWAKFKDGSELWQYDDKDNEIRFQEVLDNHDELEYFALINKDANTAYTVDLTNGVLSQTALGKPLFRPRHDMLRKDIYEYRLIYFREVELTFNTSGKEIYERKVKYFLGFQFTDKNGSNNKRLMKISKDGEWVIN